MWLRGGAAGRPQAHCCPPSPPPPPPLQLSYLKWVLRSDNATVTADCFEVICRELEPLKQAQLSNLLSSGELGVLAQVRPAGGPRRQACPSSPAPPPGWLGLPRIAPTICAPPPVPALQVAHRVEELLTVAFENYFMLSENTDNGMMDGALSVRNGTPPVLQPAVELFSERRRCSACREAASTLPYCWAGAGTAPSAAHSSLCRRAAAQRTRRGRPAVAGRAV